MVIAHQQKTSSIKQRLHISKSTSR